MFFKLSFDGKMRVPFRLAVTGIDGPVSKHLSSPVSLAFCDENAFLERLRIADFDPVQHAALARIVRQRSGSENGARFVEVCLSDRQIGLLLVNEASPENAADQRFSENAFSSATTAETVACNRPLRG